VTAMKRIACSLMLLIIIELPTYAQKMRIAIMDFEAKGVDNITAYNISELIRSEMINNDSFLVIERTQMNQILKEQGLQMTGCTEVVCAVQAGRLLSAQKILIGTVMKMGDTIIITGRIVDVTRGVGDFSETQNAYSEKIVNKAISIFVENLTRRIHGKKPVKVDLGNKREYRGDYAEHHSPTIACVSSCLLPFWSGSFNAEYNNWGIAFAITKTISLIGYFTWVLNLGSDTSSIDKSSSSNDVIVMFILMSVYGALTLADAIYSYNFVDLYNKKYLVINDENIKSVSISLSPRIRLTEDNTHHYREYKCDGMDIAAVYRF
jgi:TolB-like protein